MCQLLPCDIRHDKQTLIKSEIIIYKWEKILNHIEKYAPLTRRGNTDEVAGAAILLASDPGAFITGQVITMDGGITIAGRG